MSLRRIAQAFALCLLALPIAAQEAKPLTNQDVIRLVKLGLSAEIINAKIAESPANFDLSIEGLTTLAQSKVPNDVIKAMQAKSSSPPARPGSPAGNRNADPVKSGTAAKTPSMPLPSEKGAYLWDGKKLHLLYQSTVPSMGTNFWRSMTPFVKKKMELQLVGANAKAVFEDPQPTVLVSGLGEVIPGVPAFRWLYVKTGGMRKDRRIVGTYDVGGFFGSVSRVDNEIEVEIKKMAEGIYAIRPTKPLPDGEYGLVQVPKLAEMSAQPGFAPPIWDFGVYTEARPIERK